MLEVILDYQVGKDAIGAIEGMVKLVLSYMVGRSVHQHNISRGQFGKKNVLILIQSLTQQFHLNFVLRKHNPKNTKMLAYMLIAVWFMMTKNWKLPICLIVKKSLNKLWQSYTLGLYAPIKKDQIDLFVMEMCP